MLKAVPGVTMIKKDREQKSHYNAPNSFDSILRKEIKKLKKGIDKQEKK